MNYAKDLTAADAKLIHKKVQLRDLARQKLAKIEFNRLLCRFPKMELPEVENEILKLNNLEK